MTSTRPLLPQTMISSSVSTLFGRAEGRTAVEASVAPKKRVVRVEECILKGGDLGEWFSKVMMELD